MLYRESDFHVDGALRDVCLIDVGLEEWQAMLDSLPATRWEYSLELPTERDLMPGVASVVEVFAALESDYDASAKLAICVDGVWFFNYFYDVSEMEFTFDPAYVIDATSFEAVRRFMTWLGDACRTRVVMTMEGTDHSSMPALLEYVPGSH